MCGGGGGGVAFCIRQELTHSTASFESIFIEIKNSNYKNIIAGVIYKSPSASFNDFMTTYQQFRDLVASENKLCLISGDFNINVLATDSNNQSQEFVDVNFSHSYLPLINKPTRITATSATLTSSPILFPLQTQVFVFVTLQIIFLF